MKKYLIMSMCLASLMQASNINGEFTIAADASIGVEGVDTLFPQAKTLQKIYYTRPDIFDENGIPEDKDNGEGENPGNPGNPGNSGSSSNLRKYAEYISRNVKIDKTVFSGKLNFEDINTSVGVLLKARPNRIGQSSSIFDISRGLIYANYNTNPVKINSRLYFKTDTEENTGIQVLLDKEKRSAKKPGSFELDGDIKPINYAVSPHFSFDFKTNGKEKNYIYKAGLAFKLLDDDRDDLSLSFQYRGENDRHEPLKDLNQALLTFGAGKEVVEYYKGWELGAPTHDIPYNFDSKIEGKGGKAAYRNIGTRDIKKGHLTGLNGTVRILGMPTGALYGDTIINKVSTRFSRHILSQFSNQEELSSLLEGGEKSLFSQILSGLSLAINNAQIRKDVERIFKDTTKLSKALTEIVLEELELTKKSEGVVGDYYLTHIVPREYRKYVEGILHDIPYEDSYSNRSYLDGLKKDNNGLSSIPNLSSPIEGKRIKKPDKTYETEHNRDENMYGSTRQDIGTRTLLDDIKRSGTEGEFGSILKSLIENKGNIGAGSVVSTISNLVFSFLTGKRTSFGNLFGHNENLETFDLLSVFQKNYSEREMSGMLLNKTISKELERGLIYSYSKDKLKRDLESKGFELNLNYKNKQMPLRFSNSLVYSEHGSSFNSPIKTLTDEELNNHLNLYSEFLSTYEGVKKEKYTLKEITPRSANGDLSIVEYSHNIDNNTKLEYENKNFKVASGLNLNYRKNKYGLKKTGEFKYEALQQRYLIFQSSEDRTHKIDDKLELEYDVTKLNPYINLIYSFVPNKKWEIIPSLSYVGHFVYNNILKLKSNQGQGELKDVKASIFKRDENGRLIKSKDAKRTGDKYFDSIKSGEGVDISKISKYLVEDVEKAYEKKEVALKSGWAKPINSITPALDVYYRFTKNFRLGYHFISPVVFKGSNLEGVVIKNGLSLNVNF